MGDGEGIEFEMGEESRAPAGGVTGDKRFDSEAKIDPRKINGLREAFAKRFDSKRAKMAGFRSVQDLLSRSYVMKSMGA